jgi:hypothetical protein
VANGAFTAASDPVESAGVIRAVSGALKGEARARVVHPLPWKETFESYADGAAPPGWVNAVASAVSVTTLDGQKVLQKTPLETIFKRSRVFILRVENQPNGAVRIQGKAWPTGEPEPAAWLIDKTDPIGNRQGAPGLFLDAQFGAYLDNFSLTANQ